MKILIISHNPITTHNNMGKTMLTLFKEIKRDELCHLYVYPTIPDVDRCASNYRITDKDILKSYWRFKVRGRVIKSDDIDTENHKLYENEKDEALYRNKKNKSSLRILLRDSMWKYARWYNKALRDWIDEQKPSCIFLAPGISKFIYAVACKISKEYKIPIIAYICDDYYFVEPSKDLLGKIQQKQLKRITEKTFDKTVCIITICKELEESYSKKFCIASHTIMTGTSGEISNLSKTIVELRNLVYMGNLSYNRYIPLYEIGRSLEFLNKRDGTDYKLKIYSASKDIDAENLFKNCKAIDFCGFVSGDEYHRVFDNAEMFVHVEAFDEKYIDLVKHSISTKIADSLASGTCLFAYAPEKIASMRYLSENQSAVVCTDKKDLCDKLYEALNNSELRKDTAERALLLAKKNHDSDAVGKAVREIIENSI